MSQSPNPTAGQPVDPARLTDIPRLITAYYAEMPDAGNRAERVAFGTSGHRGTSTARSFNERHILAITQAICDFRRKDGIDGPLFIGYDTHALSIPAYTSALEVLAANGVEVRIAENDDFTPTPALSRAIIAYNRGRDRNLADGIIITPSHNPPEDGGFKYNATHGGPAGSNITGWIESRANELLAAGDIRRISYARALQAANVGRYDYLSAYVDGLADVLEMDIIRDARQHLAVDALGGAGLNYWGRIAERYALDLTIKNAISDPGFRFMTYDWDGKIRMDPSSPQAMQSLIGLKNDFDLAFACDPDHDRHGIVTKAGLMPPNHYLAVCADYLLQNRPGWRGDATIGKTAISSAIIDRAAKRNGRQVFETPVGFKFFVDGLAEGKLCFVCEESAGASLLEKNGAVWTTDKDGIALALLSAEMTARTGKDPAQLYQDLTAQVGGSFYRRSDAPATREMKDALSKFDPSTVTLDALAGETVTAVLTKAPGDNNAIGGVKVMSEGGWFAARPSGTEEIYKIYAESFRSDEHLGMIEAEAQTFVSGILKSA